MESSKNHDDTQHNDRNDDDIEDNNIEEGQHKEVQEENENKNEKEPAEQDASIQGYTDGYFWERNVGLGDRKAPLRENREATEKLSDSTR